MNQHLVKVKDPVKVQRVRQKARNQHLVKTNNLVKAQRVRQKEKISRH